MAGRLIVVSGPGGVGKGTVVERVISNDDQLVVSRSWTTRDRRPGEAETAYTFVTRDEFQAAIDSGGFLEWDHHFHNFYGSPVPADDASSDLLLEIDVNGAKQIHDGGFDALYVFIDTPSPDVQRERLIGRGDPLDKVEERVAAAAAERELAATLPYLYVINEELDRCAAEVADLIADYRRLSTD